MKKLFIIGLLLSIFTCGVFAQNTNINVTPEKDPSKWSDMTYQNIPILKILEARDAYVIIYQKDKLGSGSVVIPKSWSKGSPENPRKLKFRNSKQNSTSYMTVVKDKGEFKRVILTIPMNKALGLWGVVDTRKGLEGADKETLEELEL